ncbi:YitT family protein [Anaerorhabdus sp.]
MRLNIKNYVIVLIGSFILAFGLYNIHAQADITEGGVLGMILLLNHWFGINPSFSSIIMDYSLFALGAYFFGGKFLRYSLVASLAFSIFYSVVASWGPLLPFITQSPLLSSLCGGAFVGIGVGIVIRVGGACGGDDTLALIVRKLSGLKISTSYLIMDVTVLLLSLSYIPVQKIVFSLITVLISSNLIEFIKTVDYKTMWCTIKEKLNS